MTLGSEQAAARAGDVIREPNAVGVGHHPVQRPLPDRDGSYVIQIESPIAHERQIVVSLPGHAVRHPNSEHLRQPCGEVARYLNLVDFGQKATE